MTPPHSETRSPLGVSARGALTAYALVSVVNLTLIATGNDTWANVTQWLLMPVLAVAFLLLPPRGATPLPRLRTATLVALGFSWLGDSLPDLTNGDSAFLVMVGGFLCAQIAYLVGFLPHARRSILTRAPLLTALYAVVFVGLVLACAGGAGPLLGPVVVYGATLTTMAVLSTGLNRSTAIGGAIFMVSDSLIALGAFRHWTGVAMSVAVMATYAVAQGLLVVGISRFRSAAHSDSAASAKSERSAR